jgi:hypothetical protein
VTETATETPIPTLTATGTPTAQPVLSFVPLVLHSVSGAPAGGPATQTP